MRNTNYLAASLVLALDVPLVSSHPVSKIQACLPALLFLVLSICSQQSLDWRWCIRAMLQHYGLFDPAKTNHRRRRNFRIAVVQSFLLYIIYLITK
jgi:hypothetical protein